MKAVIKLDVPKWQIDQEVNVCFPDSMTKRAVCQKAVKGNFDGPVDSLEEAVTYAEYFDEKNIKLNLEDAIQILEIIYGARR